MQTFVPYPSFVESAQVLDRQRLGKQRVECWQIYEALRTGTPKSIANHPASHMWAKNQDALVAYTVAICEEWISRGYKDSILPRFESLLVKKFSLPLWWGGPVHANHQGRLVDKNPDFYRPRFPGVEPIPDTMNYWPTRQG